ncbi:MAG: ATP-binding cassette, subfamily F, member 3 [Chloroflexi bacterium]|jgi:ATP-binding cassette subfamily F protein 3|nr:MAG: ATP-binding cassette, subfamily F, member 3 [Chloroflexota bacterium]
MDVKLLSTFKLSKSYGDRGLFRDLTVNLANHQRIALIGANGSGKSTLLDIIAGETSADSGTVSKVKNSTVGYLKQEIVQGSDELLIAYVLKEPSDLSDLRNKIDRNYELLSSETDSGKRDQILQEIEQLGAIVEAGDLSGREHEAKEILSGLGFKTTDFSRPLREFSGGWMTRALLGQLLFLNPDILLLDEPTNHLDLEANIWFEKFLLSFSGAVMFTSHDRAFLNQVATMILAIELEEVVNFRGNYDDYLVSRAQSLQDRQAAASRQDREIKKQMLFINRFRSKAKKATQVQSRIKQLEKVERIELPRTTKRVNYSFPNPKRSGQDVITLQNITKAYGDNIVYRGLNLTFHRGDRVALVGPNGAGKSTLLKILAGVLSPDDGVRKIGHNVTSGYYAQHLLDLLKEESTPLEELQAVANAESGTNLRQILGGFLFHGDDVRKRISVLSGGEKARVALAKLLVQGSNLLLMDEPTNHLDIASREVLADALNDYEGTICFITHDRTLISQVANQVIEIDNGVVTVFPGDYDSYLYRKQLRAPNASSDKDYLLANAAIGADFSERHSQSMRSSKEGWRRDMKKQERQARTRADTINTTLIGIEAEINEMENLFSTPSQFNNGQDLILLGEKYQKLKAKAQSLWDEWDVLSTEADEINAQLDVLEETAL